MPFAISKAIPDAPRRDILLAVKDWNLMTNIRFLQYPMEWIGAGHNLAVPGLIKFIRWNFVNFQTKRCSSLVGLKGGGKTQIIHCDLQFI